MHMIIYADILFLLNLYISFLLLQSVCRLANIKTRLLRMILASFVGAALSFVVFWEIGFMAGVFVRVISCGLITLTAFGFCSLKRFLRLSASLFGVTFAFAGVVAAIWAIFEPAGLVVNHGVVYYDVSAIILIVSTLAAYFALVIIKKMMHKKLKLSKFYKVNFTLNNHEIYLKALLDSGNALSDPFSNKPIIIVSTAKLERFLPAEVLDYIHHKNTKNGREQGIRLIPYYAIKGEGLLPAVTVKDVVIFDESNCEFRIKSALIAFVTRKFGEEYNAIINEEILRKGEEKDFENTKENSRNESTTTVK